MDRFQYFQSIFKLICLLILLSHNVSRVQTKCSDRKTVFCYWASWAPHRTGHGIHNVGHIIPEYCTHLVYTFVGLDIDGELTSLNAETDIQNGGFKDFIAIKERDSTNCLKIILAIGGWGEGSEKYSLMAETAASREKFASSVMRWLVFYGFDGIDIDWEYPTKRGGLESDQQNFTELLKVLKKKLSARNRILSAAVSGSYETTVTAYEANLICNELDFLSIMGYDFQELNETSIHSPLLEDVDGEETTIANTIEYYKESGCPPEKILLGIPAYGRSYTLKDARIATLGSPISGKGKEGTYTREKGFMGFNEICELQKKQSGWKREYLNRNSSVYAYNGRVWLSYDDEKTIATKAAYVQRENLGGMMLWSIDTDDFRGICSNEKYPLLKAINKGLKWNVRKNIKIK